MHDAAAFWGADLRRRDLEVVRAAGLPPDTGRFLVETGLPGGERWSLSFRFDEPWPALPALVDRPDLIQFGSDGPAAICVDRTDGRVWIVEGAEVCFLNSSVMNLGEFLILHERYLREVWKDPVIRVLPGVTHVVPDTKDDRSAQRHARRRLRDTMRACDPAAMGKDNVWPLLLKY